MKGWFNRFSKVPCTTELENKPADPCPKCTMCHHTYVDFDAARDLDWRNPWTQSSVTSGAAIEILRSPNKHILCLAVKVEEDKITFVMGDLKIKTKLKSDFPPNAKFSPNFDAPEIRDWGQTVAFGDYEAEVS